VPATEKPRSYLDIETAYDQSLTIVGILREDREIIQLVSPRITTESILEYMEGSGVIHTYNGHSFDLPRIRSELGLDLRRMFPSRDLMHDCWKRKWMGGFKKVEERVGIARQSKGIDGMMAMRLWEEYLDEDNLESLQTLLLYNREDVENLWKLREIIDKGSGLDI
jgi:hypothetical protein